MRVLLVSMPWAIFNRPSIQLGTLKSYLQSRGIKCVTSHPFLDVARLIGTDSYHRIAENSWAGEALYSGLLFPEHSGQAEKLFEQEMRGSLQADFQAIIRMLEHQFTTWIETKELESFDLIGFTVCFAQLPPSLYGATRIKKIHPDIPIVFGGSTCTPAIGTTLLEVFPQVDHVITGEGERPLENLCRLLAGEKEVDGANIISRNPGRDALEGVSELENLEVRELDQLPVPDFDDYFQDLRQSRMVFIPTLPVEFSRGCWWNKCTFCNLNLQWCSYRRKSAARMKTEIQHLKTRYQCLDFSFTDNALPVHEADRFFESMSDDENDLRFFAEIRAIQKQETYHIYRRGGLESVQVGIEALSSRLLKRMKKGVTVMDNVAAMKYAATAGMKLEGNLILEFPGSTVAEVQETLQVLDAVLPYRPLQGAGFFLGLGSPVWSKPADYGIKAITRHPKNRLLYPDNILNRLEMLIKSYRGDRQTQRKQWQPVRDKIAQWNDFHENRNPSRPPLSWRDGGNFLIIRQERPDPEEKQKQKTYHHRLRGLSRQIYLACEQPVTRKELLHRFQQVTKEQLSGFLDDLEKKLLLFREDDTVLALALRERAASGQFQPTNRPC
ncbi:RiPP maturation radical SAM C-methyltransferase [Desulfolithobacter sp.]